MNNVTKLLRKEHAHFSKDIWKDIKTLPSGTGVAMGSSTLGPDAKGSRHENGNPKPAAAHNERHEQTEVMNRWDLTMHTKQIKVTCQVLSEFFFHFACFNIN